MINLQAAKLTLSGFTDIYRKQRLAGPPLRKQCQSHLPCRFPCPKSIGSYIQLSSLMSSMSLRRLELMSETNTCPRTLKHMPIRRGQRAPLNQMRWPNETAGARACGAGRRVSCELHLTGTPGQQKRESRDIKHGTPDKSATCPRYYGLYTMATPCIVPPVVPSVHTVVQLLFVTDSSERTTAAFSHKNPIDRGESCQTSG